MASAGGIHSSAAAAAAVAVPATPVAVPCSTVLPSATTVSIVPGPGFGKVISVQTQGSAPAPLPPQADATSVASTAASSSSSSSSSSAAAIETPPPADPAVMAAKHSLRVSMARTLNALNAQQLADKSAALLERLVAHPAYVRARAIGLFVSMPTGELQTLDLIRHALQQGKRIFVPRIEPPKKKSHSVATTTAASSSASTAPSVSLSAPFLPAVAPGGGRMRMLEVHSMAELESFAPNRWGIREPPLTAATDGSGGTVPRLGALDCPELDLMVCPGVAFDSQCRRLGHGKGYYDCYLASLQSHRAALSLPPVATIAVGFDEQVVDAVPVGLLDLPLDEILTPTHHFTCSSDDTVQSAQA